MPAPVVLVSNRGPLSFQDDGGRLVATRGGGGLVSGLAPLVAGTDAIWIAAALSDADRAAAAEGVIEADGLRVRTLAIDPDVMALSYDVVCNAMLWFLYHALHDASRRPIVDAGFREAWDAYRRYNAEFADVVVDETPQGAVVLVQDYHLALLAPLVKSRRPDLRLVHFSHTPFAPPLQMRMLPDDLASELLDGMAAHDACGFHSERWAADFRACCLATIGREPTTFVSPLAPDPDDIRAAASSERCEAEFASLDEAIGERRLIVRVDRIELSKNMLRGFRAFDQMLVDRPDLRETVVFRALGYPSREGLPEYLAYRSEVEALADVINRRWQTDGWTPIELDLSDDFPKSVAHLRRYDVLLVNPIRDGLNLVAMEGPLVNERDGTVVLSREAGVHDQLDGAVRTVNPFDIADQAAALADALDLDASTRAARATELLRRAEARTPADWLAEQLAAADSSRPS
ncbi:MAG: trehalose-6-phosphate synthase [Acidimicrobiales bacterium]|nr:trehalose-6-phosphate synthase [Acidimicrobiales bacterium]